MSAPRRVRAFSVVELLIALAILAVVMTAFIFGMAGRRTEGVKSAAWFHAVSIAQKICDDLDHRTRENPYALDELERAQEEFALLAADAPLFRYLEDDDGNLRLGDGASLADLAGGDREFLKNCRIALKIERGVGNGLARVRVAVRWTEKARDQEYAAEHLVCDLPSSVRTDEGAFELPALSDAYLVSAFFDTAGPLPDLARAHGVDRQLLLDLATVQYLSRTGVRQVADAESALRKRRAASDAWSADGLADAARLHEGCALDLLRLHALAAPAFARLAAREAAGTLSFGTLFTNRRARALLPDLSRFADRIMNHDNGACFAARFNAELTSACNLALRLAGDPAVAQGATYRQRAAAARKAEEYAIALAQNGASAMRADFDGRAVALETHLLDGLAALRAQAERRDYNLADRLGRAIGRIRAKSFEPHEEISARLSNMNGVASAAARVLAAATDLVGGGAFY